MNYSISPYIRFFFLDGNIHAFISKTNKRIKFNPLILDLLVELSSIESFSKDDFLVFTEKNNLKEGGKILELYIEYGIFEEFGANIGLPIESLNYIYETYDYPFLDYSEGETFFKDFSRMKGYLDTENVPERSKIYENSNKSIPLVHDLEESKDIFYDDNINRKEQTNITTLSNIFHYTLGVKGGISFPFQGGFLRKFVPSGGARHTTEAYLFVKDIDGLDPFKIYHFNGKESSFDEINIFTEQEVLKLFPELINLSDYSKKEISDIKGIVVFTSVFERSMWRYRDSRSYRVILTDIGHVIENMNLLYTKLTGKITFQGIGLMESKVEEKLLIKSHFKESAMKYLILT